MTTDDLGREILINRAFLIILFLGGGAMFAFVGVMAFWSVQMVRAELQTWRETASEMRNLAILMAQTVKNVSVSEK